MSLASRSLDLLDRVRSHMEAGEDRPGQREMVEAVAAAIGSKEHLVVQAGTGTGKSLAYLVAAISSGRTTVVATATKALQDQLADKELPTLAKHVDKDLSWAVLKGRSNYLCRQRLDEASAPQAQLGLEGVAEAAGGTGRLPEKTLKQLQKWAETTTTGDRADLAEEPQPWVWSAVSVGPRECPGASKCPRGEDCFAERARARAASADVIIVNTHLYGLYLGSHGAVLPDHDVVVFDEAHEVEDIISATTGLEIGPGTITALARTIGGLVADDSVTDGLEEDAARLSRMLAPLVGSRLRRGLPTEIGDALGAARGRIMEASAAVRKIPDSSADVTTRKARVASAIGGAVLDIDSMIAMPAESVMWVGGTEEHPRLEMAPLDVGLTLDTLLWNPEPGGLEIVIGDGAGERSAGERSDGDPSFGLPDTVVFTSATVPDSLVERLRIPPDDVTVIDVGTPFDFEHHALLYCAAHLPDPRSERYGAAVTDELVRLIGAAGGRTLALFTSHRAMNEAADAVADRVGVAVLRQGDRPKPALIEEFATDETSCLFATMGFWAGIDVPGPALSLVTIDKIPFPRPDEPLMAARRERAGAAGFTTIDLPRAATLLAQGSGRLIRAASDRGVVAVLDPRLANKASYRWQLIRALPPMRRTKDFDEVAAFLAEILPA
ncbi:MAG: ATP-dependent DNA helicase [Acidimicrobiales bacterium]